MGEGVTVTVTLPGFSPGSNACSLNQLKATWLATKPIKLLFFSKFVAAVHHCRVKLKLFHFCLIDCLIDWWCILDMACYWTIAGHLKHSFRVGLCAKFWISLRVLFCCVGEFYCRSRKSTNCNVFVCRDQLCNTFPRTSTLWVFDLVTKVTKWYFNRSNPSMAIELSEIFFY